MPEMSGNENAQSLRNRSETKKIPRIFLTALITEDEGGAERMANIGENNFIAGNNKETCRQCHKDIKRELWYDNCIANK